MFVTPSSTDRSFHVEHSQETLANCPLCGSARTALSISLLDHSISKDEFTLHDCSDCGFRFTNPRPSEDSIGAYYEDPNYISHNATGPTLLERIYRGARKWAISRKSSLIRHHARDGKILDIGCGTGEFLAYQMSRGFHAIGVEPGLDARELAIANYSLQVFPSLEQVPTQEQFRVVTMWHALEHIPDPRSLFKTLYALLEPNGLLLVAVPDRDSWDCTHYGAHWAAWDVPRHLSHFRRKDIHRLLDEHGFQLIQTRRMHLDAFYISLLSERYKGAKGLLGFVKAMALGAWSDLNSLLANRPTSSSLFVARKPAL